MAVVAVPKDTPDQPADLQWSLSALSNKERGRKYLTVMSDHIPIYSATVKQLYARYDLAFAGEAIVVLPDQYAFTETFSNIPPTAVRRTGIQVIPTSKGLHVSIPVRGKEPLRAPLSVGLAMVRRRLPGPLLPAIQKGDLRDYEHNRPALNLHLIDTTKLVDLSVFQRSDVERILNQKIMALEAKSGSILI